MISAAAGSRNLVLPQPRICFVMPYFGSWPFWLPFFIESCRANPSIDWLFFTDCGQIENCPANVRIVPMSFDAYCARVAQALGIEFRPQLAYKLCDIRPAFGCIHEADLLGYDFWAFGDIDLVFGNLRAYFTPDRLMGKDLVSTHARRISGHCCLVRNNARMRDAFRRIPDWQRRFADSRHQALDERAFSHIFIRYKNWPEGAARIMRRLNPWYRRAEFVEAFSTPGAKVPWVDGSRRFPERWTWRHGEITNDRDPGRRFPYFHFVVWKKEAWRDLPLPPRAELEALAASGEWQIDASGFHPLSS